jgi:hypothetical protein
MNLRKTALRAAASVVCCAAMGWSAGAAALQLEVTATSPTVVQGSRAYQSVTFDFQEAYPMSGVDLYLDYDPTGLSFVEGASSVSFAGMSPTLPELIAAFKVQGVSDAFSSEAEPGKYQLFISLFTPSEDWPVVPPGQIVLTAAFDIAPGYVGSSALAVSGQLYGLAAEPPFFQPDGFEGLATISVTAVPEPETWAMLLGGLALMAGVARRRAHRG